MTYLTQQNEQNQENLGPGPQMINEDLVFLLNRWLYFFCLSFYNGRSSLRVLCISLFKDSPFISLCNDSPALVYNGSLCIHLCNSSSYVSLCNTNSSISFYNGNHHPPCH